MELNFTSEYEKFEAKDGDYGLTGNKVSVDGDFVLVECGQITKEEDFLGTFYAKKTEEGWKISLYEMSIEEAATVVPVIRAVIEEMGGLAQEE